MSNVHSVFVQLKRPKGAFPGREGAYIVENDTVILTDREGKPALDDKGYRYTHKPGEGDRQSDCRPINQTIARTVARRGRP